MELSDKTLMIASGILCFIGLMSILALLVVAIIKNPMVLGYILLIGLGKLAVILIAIVIEFISQKLS